jgi:uncharacterized protein YkwD
MKKFLLLFFIIILLGGVLFFKPMIQKFFQSQVIHFGDLYQKVNELNQKENQKEIILPPPLKRLEKKKSEVILTKEGIINETNKQREKYGLPPLKENLILNKTAKAKADDMFKNQYFSHYSLTGEGIENLAKKFGYEFLIMGENLAMGNFSSEKELVSSWMESEGHRKNILNPKYQEIGVAVEKGVFEGETVWIAVQHFALPLSFCPEPDPLLKEKIETNKKTLSEFQKELLSLKKEIENTMIWDEDYFKKIENYNQLVIKYNILVKENKELIDKYNSQVILSNQCLIEVLSKNE